MHALLALFKKELIGYFVTPVAYVFIAIFLFTSSAFTFYLGNFYGIEQASLEKFFIWHPWLYLFLIPAISMRLWAEERKSGTIELLSTLPIPLWQMVLGKFLASWLFTGIALLLTTPIWITVSYLGDPDNGIIFASYLGSFLMAGAYLSVGSCVSVLTKSQVVSFIISVVVCFIFTISGFNFLLALLQEFLPQPIIEVISSFSFITNFSEITKGILEINSIGFFVVFIVLALFLNVCLLSKGSYIFKRSKLGKFLNFPIILSSIIVLFFSLNIIMNYSLRGFNFDLTENSVYTLSQGTKNVLKNLKEPLRIRFFYSQKLGSAIPFVNSYASRVKALLKQYASISEGKIVLEVISPEAFSEEEDQAVSFGLQAIPLGNAGAKLYFGLAATNTVDDTRTVPFIDPNRESFLEYDLTQVIYELSNHKKPIIGIMSWMDMKTPQQSPYGGGQGSDWMILERIKENFDFRELDKNIKEIPKEIDSLMIVHPSAVSEDTEYAIDQFVLRGGKLLAFVDPYSEVQANISKNSNLKTLFNAWGVSLSENKVVLDMDNSMTVQSGGNSVLTNVSKPNWIALNKEYLNTEDIVTSELNKIHFISGGSLEFLSNKEGVNFTPLFTSSKNSMLVSIDKIYDTEDLLTNFISSKKLFTLAARISGKIKTAFPDRDEKNHLLESKDTANIIIVADTDILRDQFWLQKQNFFGRYLILQISDNASFVINSLDNLSGSSDLIGLRSRSKIKRNFKVVQKLRKKAESRFLEKEKVLKMKLENAEAKLKQINTSDSKEGESKLVLTEAQQQEMERFRQDILDTRKQLREVTHSLNKDIENLGGILKLIHMILIPLFVIILGFCIPPTLGIKRR